MLRLETRSWRTELHELQRRLDREAIATMEVISGEETLQVRPQDLVDPLRREDRQPQPIPGYLVALGARGIRLRLSGSLRSHRLGMSAHA